MISQTKKSQFANAVAKLSYDLETIGGSSNPLLIDELIEKFDERVSLNSVETREARSRFFGISGTGPEDFTETLISIDNEKSVLVGIRHMNLSLNHPYLEVWPNWIPEDKSDIREIADKVLNPFKVFGPKYLCLWLNPEGHLIDRLAGHIEIGQHVLAASVQAIGKAPKPPNFDGLGMQPLVSDSFYPNYVSDYAQFHHDFPELKLYVPVVQLEDMRQSVQENLIYQATYLGARAGLIAAIKKNFLGSEGIYFLEIFLLPKFRGLGLAPVLQRKFIEKATQIQQNENTLVWGTIDSRNLASLKTALRVGRKIVSTECFYRLEN